MLSQYIQRGLLLPTSLLFLKYSESRGTFNFQRRSFFKVFWPSILKSGIDSTGVRDIESDKKIDLEKVVWPIPSCKSAEIMCHDS